MDQQTNRQTNETGSFERDEINVMPTPYPVGVGFGAASGGMAGAAIGSAVAGPIGAAVGAMFGGFLGACGGHGIARAVTGSDALELIDEYDARGCGEADCGDVYNYAQKDYARIRDECERAHDDCASLAIPWDQAGQFTTRGWGRLSGVIGPRDTDRGLRGGI
jgi:hypothetical protein